MMGSKSLMIARFALFTINSMCLLVNGGNNGETTAN